MRKSLRRFRRRLADGAAAVFGALADMLGAIVAGVASALEDLIP